MEQEICPICIEPVTDEYKPYYCNHLYHKNCIKQLQISKCNEYKYNCSLCKSALKLVSGNKKLYKNYIFNNFLEKDMDVQYYIHQWSNKECLENNHKFKLETLGDWTMSNSRNFYMDFKFMLVKCEECNKDQLIK